MGGSYIALTTAFLVVNVPPALPIPAAVVWLAPTAIGTLFIVRATRQWMQRFAS